MEESRTRRGACPEWSEGFFHLSLRIHHSSLLKGRLQLKGLQKNHDYILSLNGYPGKDGNDMLPQLHGKEGYVDFTSVTSSNKGEIQTEINVPWPPGKYVVKFLVKDPEANWRIAWQKEFLEFSIHSDWTEALLTCGLAVPPRYRWRIGEQQWDIIDCSVGF